jgi:hypothetical protein
MLLRFLQDGFYGLFQDRIPAAEIILNVDNRLFATDRDCECDGAYPDCECGATDHSSSLLLLEACVLQKRTLKSG